MLSNNEFANDSEIELVNPLRNLKFFFPLINKLLFAY